MGRRRTLDRALHRSGHVRSDSTGAAITTSQICLYGRRGQIGKWLNAPELKPGLIESKPNGYYGTSVKLNWVMDHNRGILLSYKMNGEMLRPDHGKPLRAVVPGQIGGRSVKWLKKLIVTAEPSTNWYHIYDNRVLP